MSEAEPGAKASSAASLTLPAADQDIEGPYMCDNGIAELPGYVLVTSRPSSPLSPTSPTSHSRMRIPYKYRKPCRTLLISAIFCITLAFAARQGFLGDTLHSLIVADRASALELRVHYFWGNVSQQYILASHRTSNRVAEEQDVCARYLAEPSDPKIYLQSVWDDMNSYTQSDITLVTQMSLVKLPVFSQLLDKWPGPVSASLYVKWEELQQLPTMLSQIPVLMKRRNVDIHIILSTMEFYPVNFLRNLALRSAQTQYVFLSDVDFLPSPGAHESIQRHIRAGLLDGKRTLVVPGFEFFETPEEYPSSKQDLLQMWDDGKLQPFHDDRNGGASHHSTDSDRWRESPDPYMIVPEASYEPYLVLNKDLVLPYEEKFLGRMFDKVTHTFEIIGSGFEFVVLPDVYTIHMPHPEIKDVPYMDCAIDLFYKHKQELKTRFPDTMADYNFKPEWQLKAKQEQEINESSVPEEDEEGEVPSVGEVPAAEELGVDEVPAVGEVPTGEVPAVNEIHAAGDVQPLGEVPEVQEIPEVGESPAVGEVPAAGEVPAVGDILEVGEVLAQGGVPAVPAEVPAVPAAGEFPEAPAAFEVPAVPEEVPAPPAVVPIVPIAGDIPAVPAEVPAAPAPIEVPAFNAAGEEQLVPAAENVPAETVPAVGEVQAIPAAVEAQAAVEVPAAGEVPTVPSE